MKYAVLLISLSPVFAWPTAAQSNSLALAGGTAAESMPEIAADVTNAAGEPAARDPLPSREPPTRSGEVLSVFPEYDLEAYGGYTYLRFREGGGFSPNLNGFNVTLAYYPRGGWIGPEGEFVLGFGTQNKKQAARLLLGLGGPTFRWSAPRQSVLWAHVLAGGSHFLPQTALGGQAAFAYELGGGLDIKARNRHFAYRVGADLVGTRYFSKSEFSPKISIGLVLKF